MKTHSSGWGFGGFADFVAAALAIGAGVYLLQYNAVDTTGGTSWFQIIGHGMGIYFIGKGLYMSRALHLNGKSVDHLRYLAEWARYDHHDEEERVRAGAVPVD